MEVTITIKAPEMAAAIMAHTKKVEWDSEWGGDCPWREPDPEMDKLRRKAGLKELHPPPWYKRIARFYDENWESMFEGTGPGIYFLLLLSSLALVFVAIGRATGWWGGVM